MRGTNVWMTNVCEDVTNVCEDVFLNRAARGPRCNEDVCVALLASMSCHASRGIGKFAHSSLDVHTRIQSEL